MAAPGGAQPRVAGRGKEKRRSLPLLTLTLVVVALLLGLVPGVADWLRLERDPLLRQPWRFVTGHLVHAGGIAWADLVAFALFGTYVERRSRALFVVTLVASAVLASTAILPLTGHDPYLGSSALTSGLVVAAALEQFRGPTLSAKRVVGSLLLLALAAKLALELAGRWPATFHRLPEGYVPAPLAHLAGALGGAVARSFVRGLGRALGFGPSGGRARGRRG